MSVKLSYSLLDNDEPNDNNNEELVNNVNAVELDTTITIENKFDPQYQNDLDIILEMGYDPKLAKKVYVLLMPVDINEALDFLTKEDGVYHHEFIKRNGRKDECFVCGEPGKNHINYRESLLEFIRNSFGNSKNQKNDNIDDVISGNIIENSNEDKKNNDEIICCNLCFEEMTEEETLKNSIYCGHVFCSDCYLNYFENKIKSNSVGKITCMQHKCPYSFEEEFIISHLKGDIDLINKYKKFKLKSDLINDPNVKFCPIRDCESYARKEGDNKYVTCLEGHKFCFECSKPWHGKKKCQDEIDKDFKKWKKNKIVKKCPQCKMWTEKNLGCNHMTCAECKYQWCWLCGGEYSPGHFDLGGPCSGLQFSSSSIFNHCICLYLYKLVIILFHLVIFLYLLPIIILSHFVLDYDYRIHEGFADFIKFLNWFFLSLAYPNIYIPLGFILFLVTLFSNKLREKIIEFALDY